MPDLRIAAVLLIGCLLPAAATLAENEEGGVDGAVHGAWTVRCQDLPEGRERQCYIFQERVTRDSGERVLRVAVLYPPESDAPVVYVTLPLGISLPPGGAVQIDDREPARFPFAYCDPNGCLGALPLDEELLTAFKTGAEAQVTFFDLERVPVTLPLSLEGFTAGLRALR